MINIGELQFATKKAATEYFRGMLHRYWLDDERVNDADALSLDALLRWHPEAEEKRGVGVSYFFVQSSGAWSTPCFFIRRVDGTEIDFSFRWCLRQVN